MNFTRNLAAVVAAVGFASGASAAAIISDGNVSLGVDDLGQLNIDGGVADVDGTTDVGVRWIDAASGDEFESTSHGCLCEGWGLALDGSIVGEADNAAGVSGLAPVSFASDATTATSVVELTGSDGVQVTHDFALASETDDLYRVKVTIENTGSTDYASMEYRRVMDWDTSPTPFDEFVSIGGTATTTLLDFSSDDGFDGGNPLSNPEDIAGCGTTTDFSDCGPDDHGAVFDFALGALAAGESFEFEIYYGGALGERAALAALAAVGAELYSFGWSACDADQNGFADAGTRCTEGELTPTFIFAFSGVGGTPVVPGIPLPATAWLMVGALGALTLRRKARKA